MANQSFSQWTPAVGLSGDEIVPLSVPTGLSQSPWSSKTTTINDIWNAYTPPTDNDAATPPNARRTALSIPQFLDLKNAVFLDTFSTIGGSGWTATNGTAVADTTNYLAGTQSIAATTTGASDEYLAKTFSSIDCSGATNWLWLRVYMSPIQYANVSQIYAIIFDGSGYNRVFYLEYAAFGRSGYIDMMASIGQYNATSGSLALNAITQMRVYAVPKSGGVPTTVSFDIVAIAPAKSLAGHVIIGSDGTYADFDNTLCYMASIGWRATIATNQNYLDVTGHMSTSRLQLQRRAGHKVIPYLGSYFTPSLWPGWTPEQKMSAVLQGQAWARSLGADDCQRLISVPGVGDLGGNDDIDMLGTYVDAIFGASVNTNQMVNLGGPYFNQSWFCGVTTSVPPSITTISALSTLTAASHGVLIYWMHNNGQSGDTSTQAISDIAAMKTAGLTCITLDEYIYGAEPLA